MKKTFLFFAMTAMAIIASAQSFNSDLNDLGQYVQRMYMNEPFEGARVIENVDNCYLITVVAEKPGNNEYATNRKAEVKGLSYANKYLNGEMSMQTQCFIRERTQEVTPTKKLKILLNLARWDMCNQCKCFLLLPMLTAKKYLFFASNSPCRRNRKAKKVAKENKFNDKGGASSSFFFCEIFSSDSRKSSFDQSYYHKTFCNNFQIDLVI